MIPATMVVSEALDALAYRAWVMSPKISRRFATALRTSSCSRAKTLRHQLSLLGYTDIDAMFQQTVTPIFMMALLDDLAAIGALTRAEASSVQDAILGSVRRDGSWVQKEDRRQHGRVAHGGASFQRHTQR